MSNSDIKIAVLHHPFEWLAEFDRNRIEKRLMQECDFILHGHQHKPGINVIHGNLGNCIIIPAGSCYNRRLAENPLYTNSYNFVHIDFNTKKGIIFLRRWSDSKSRWVEDIESSACGKFEFILPPSNNPKLQQKSLVNGSKCTHSYKPYLGLSPFSENESDIFFGRQSLIEKMANQLRCNPQFLAVVGSSGSGKSSIIQAGLLPLIRGGDILGFEDVHIISFRPGFDPQESLKQASRTSGIISHKDIWMDLQSYRKDYPKKRIVIFIDQFEELFIYSEERLKTETGFLKQLSLALKSKLITLIISIRADFYNSLLSSTLGSYLGIGQINIIPMNEREMKEAIEKPADASDLKIEPGLVDRIINDLKNIKDPLPLLEFTRYQLWIRGGNKALLSHKDYNKIGYAAGAVSQWANETFEQLNNSEKELCKRIFTRLIHYGQGIMPDSRRRILSSEIISATHNEEINKLIKKLADSRLLITDYDLGTRLQTVEIIHEALIREWTLLKNWIAEEHEFLLWRQLLGDKIIEWEKRRHEEFCFLNGSFLDEAKSWLEKRPDDFNLREEQYIKASIDRNKKLEEKAIDKTMMGDLFSGNNENIESIIFQNKWLELKFKESKELRHHISGLSLLSENMTDVVHLNTPDLDIIYLYVSPSIKITGYNPSELIGRSPFEKLISPEDAESMRQLLEMILAEKSQKVVEYRIRSKNGSNIWVRTSFSPILDSEEKVVFLECSTRDITEIKLAEEALRGSERRLADVITLLPEAVMVIDLDGRVMVWNRAMENLTGVMAEDILGKGDYEYSLPFYGYRRPILVDMVLKPHDGFESEFFGFKREGTTVIGEAFIPTFGPHGSYLLKKATALIDSIGNTVGAIESIRDTTERRLMEQKLERSRTELHVAAEIRRSFIPKRIPSIPNFEVAAVTVPAMEVGGDFYDFISLPEGYYGLVIADVEGKSIPAAIFMAISRMIIRTSAAHQSIVSEVLWSANNIIASDATAGMVVTLLFGILDGEALTLKYADAGHPTPLLFKNRDHRYIEETVPGIPLGITEGVNYEERTIRFEPGDVAVFYTDGVTEAMNSQGEPFGLNRLIWVISKGCQSSAEDIMGEILQEVTTFQDQGQNDDITLIVLKAKERDNSYPNLIKV
jgi:PAS domain S-box-containing protein